MLREVLDSMEPESVLSLAAVALVAAITFFLARWLGRRLKGSTRLGLRGLERLAAPVTLLVVAASAALLKDRAAVDPETLSRATEAAAILAGFWLVSRSIDVLWNSGEQSARLRHHPAARAALTSLRRLGKVVVWVAAIATLAVRFGAAQQLYLVLGGLGAALAFAARDPIRNAFAFATMVVDPPFRLGDRVRLEDFRGGVAAEGRVLSISFSAVTLETARRTQVVVSNVRVEQLRVENFSVADRRRLELTLPVPAEMSTEALRTTCDEVEADLKQHPSVSDFRAPHVWVSGSRDGVRLKASLWLRKASLRRNAERDLVLLIRARIEQHLGKGSPPRGSRQAPARLLESAYGG